MKDVMPIAPIAIDVEKSKYSKVPTYMNLVHTREIFKKSTIWSEVYDVEHMESGVYVVVNKTISKTFRIPGSQAEIHGEPKYIGQGLIGMNNSGTGMYNGRPFMHMNDALCRELNRAPEDYAIYIVACDIPKLEAEKYEAILISWMVNVLGLQKIANSYTPILEGMMINQRMETKHLNNVDEFLNIPEKLWK